jgi:hypothetical protein
MARVKSRVRKGGRYRVEPDAKKSAKKVSKKVSKKRKPVSEGEKNAN